MGKFKTFAYAFYKSLISINYYKDVLRANPKFSLKYFFVLITLLITLSSLISAVRNAPKLQGQIQKTVNELVRLFPQELEIKIENGTLTTNSPIPIILPMDSKSRSQPNMNYDNLLIIDTDGTVEEFESYSTLMMVNSKNILTRDANNQLQTYPLTNLPNMLLNRDNITEKANAFLDVVSSTPTVIGFLFLIYLVVFTMYHLVWRGVYLLLFAGLLAFIGRLMKHHMLYGRYVQIAIHTITLPFLVELIANILDISLQLVVWFSLVHFIFALIVLFSLKEKQA